MRELYSHHYPDHKVETPSRVYLLIYHEMLWKELISKLTFWPYLRPEKSKKGQVWRHWKSIESPDLEKFVEFDETIAIIVENVEHKAEKCGYWKSVACKYQVHFIAQRKHMVQIKLTLRMKSDLLLEKTWFCFWINSKACWNMLRVNSVGIRWVSESAHGVRWWRRIFRHVTLSNFGYMFCIKN